MRTPCGGVMSTGRADVRASHFGGAGDGFTTVTVANIYHRFGGRFLLRPLAGSSVQAGVGAVGAGRVGGSVRTEAAGNKNGRVVRPIRLFTLLLLLYQAPPVQGGCCVNWRRGLRNLDEGIPATSRAVSSPFYSYYTTAPQSLRGLLCQLVRSLDGASLPPTHFYLLSPACPGRRWIACGPVGWSYSSGSVRSW